MEKATKIAENVGMLGCCGQAVRSAGWDIFKLYTPAHPPPRHPLLPFHPAPPASRSILIFFPLSSHLFPAALILVSTQPVSRLLIVPRPLFTTFILTLSPFFTLQSSFLFPPLNCLALTYLQGFQRCQLFHCPQSFSLFSLFIRTLFVNVQRRRIREQIMKHRSAFHTLFRKNSQTAQRGERSHFPLRFYPHLQPIWLFLCLHSSGIHPICSFCNATPFSQAYLLCLCGISNMLSTAFTSVGLPGWCGPVFSREYLLEVSLRNFPKHFTKPIVWVTFGLSSNIKDLT